MTGPYREWSREQLERAVHSEERHRQVACRESRKLGFGLGVTAAVALIVLGIACDGVLSSCMTGDLAESDDNEELIQECARFCGPEHYVSVDPEENICRCSSDTHDEHRVYEHDMADSFQSYDRGLYEQCRRFCGAGYMDVDYENERCLCVDYIGQRRDVRIVRAHPLGELDPCFGPGVTSVGREHP